MFANANMNLFAFYKNMHFWWPNMVKDVYLKNAGEINSSKIEKANRLSHQKTIKIQSYPNFDAHILTFFTLSFVVAGIKATFFCRC